MAFDVGGFLGGFTGGLFSSHTAAKNRKAMIEESQKNYDRQKEFAQNSIQWRANDAEKAGFHRLAALGQTSTQYIPTQGGLSDSGSSQAWSQMGQAIGNAISPFERKMQQLELEGKELENKQKAVDIAKSMGQTNSIAQDGSAISMGDLGLTGGMAGQAVSLSNALNGFATPPYAFQGANNEVQFVKSPEGFLHIMPSQDFMDYYSENLMANVIQGARNAFNPFKGSDWLNEAEKWAIKKGDLNPKTHMMVKSYNPLVGWVFKIIKKSDKDKLGIYDKLFNK